MQAGGGGSEIFAIFRNFPQLHKLLQFFRNWFCLSPCVLVGALCVPCAEVLLLEALGGWVTATQFSRIFSAIFGNFPQFFAIGFDAP